MYKVILFDLDGTLTESCEEITKSVQYTLEKIGKPEPELEKLGVFENRPYEGIKDLLDFLQKKGYLLAVVSSKPEIFVKQILGHFEMSSYFTEIVGSEMDGTRTKKTEVIEEALLRLGVQRKREQVLMIGDKEHDVIGAKEAGIPCVAVSYGYGTKEELENAKPLSICSSTEELLSFFV